MKHIYNLRAALTAVAIFLGAMLFAQNGKVSVQGVLKNFNGTVYNGTSADMTFRIYDQPTGGTALWTESQTGVAVNGGVYNAYLGATPAGLTALQGLAFDQPYYLGITIEVGANPLEMTPRVEMAYGVKSLSASTADHATNADTAEVANMAYGVAFSGSGISEIGGDLTLSANPGNVVIGGSGVLVVDSIKADFNYIHGSTGAPLKTNWTGKWFIAPGVGDTLKVYSVYFEIMPGANSAEQAIAMDRSFSRIYPFVFNTMLYNGSGTLNADDATWYTPQGVDPNHSGIVGRIGRNDIWIRNNTASNLTIWIYAEFAGRE